MTDQVFPVLRGLPKIDPWPCTCFTELKLSESRKHARRYGRLGIGLKRGFVFARHGRPVAYFPSAHDMEWVRKDMFLRECAGKIEPQMMHFFQPMNSEDKLNYDLYSESEWRIVFRKEMLGRSKSGEVDRAVDPRDPNSESSSYLQSLGLDRQSKLKYLVPVDGWLAVIIYPSLAIKAMAWESQAVRELIRSIKANQCNRPNRVERGNMPVEMDLDLCRNF